MPSPVTDCREAVEFGFVDFAPEQDNFLPYDLNRDIIFVNDDGDEVRFSLESSVDDEVELMFNAECEDDSLQLVEVSMTYRNVVDIFRCDTLGLRIGQYRYATIQFNLSFELDPFDPLNPYSVVGINLVDANEPYFTFAGCWYNWALDNLRINSPLEKGIQQTVNGISYDNVLLSQFCPGGSFQFVPGFGIILFEYDDQVWTFDRFE